MLPRYVVNNEADDIDKGTSAEPPNSSGNSGVTHQHAIEIPDSIVATINELHESYKKENNKEKRIIFADSLAEVYRNVGKLDSLAKYTEVKAIEIPSIENFINAGDGYYEAFNFAVDQSKRNLLAAKAQEYYKRVLDENSSLLDVKSKLAMTYIAGANPMQGITLLREILEADPENESGLFNMGILAIQSGQYERASERFKNLVSLYPQNLQAQFYLGLCYFELGEKDNARRQFELVKSMESDPAVLATIDGYLKELN